MNRDARALFLSALREVFDGSWTRHVGSEGGRQLHWEGKAGMIGAVTPSIDRHHAVMGALGERFILYRVHVADVVDPETRPGNSPTTKSAASPLDLAAYVVKARTSVERDGYNQELLVMPSAEAPGRLVGSLGGLLSGAEAVGADLATAWRIVTKAAWDCVPDIRRSLLHHLRDHPNARIADVATATGIPRTAAERNLDDLVLLGLA